MANDALMERTKRRPLPLGKPVAGAHALVSSPASLGTAGVAILAVPGADDTRLARCDNPCAGDGELCKCAW